MSSRTDYGVAAFQASTYFGSIGAVKDMPWPLSVTLTAQTSFWPAQALSGDLPTHQTPNIDSPSYSGAAEQAA